MEFVEPLMTPTVPHRKITTNMLPLNIGQLGTLMMHQKESRGIARSSGFCRSAASRSFVLSWVVVLGACNSFRYFFQKQIANTRSGL